MTVHPNHQYKGAGSMMTKWGTDLADDLNALVRWSLPSNMRFGFTNALKSIIEATVAGRWLYEKSGFAVKHHYAVRASGKLDKGIAQRLFFMVRPREEGQ
jgi:hypothetical protein